MECDVLLKATKVDYVYNKDPMKHKDAKKYVSMKYQDVIEQSLGVMDLTAVTLCRENRLPVYVFNMGVPGNMRRVIQGEPIGTRVGE